MLSLNHVSFELLVIACAYPFHVQNRSESCLQSLCNFVIPEFFFTLKVGDDEFGYMLADILKQNNVNNQGLLFDPHARTALAFVSLRSDGEREFMFYRNPSADMLLEEKELDLDLIRKVYISIYKCILLPFQYLCLSLTIGFLSCNS
jgi:hypothetical protein